MQTKNEEQEHTDGAVNDFKSFMPDLPVEILSKIFKFATNIPGAFEIEDYAAIAAFTRDHHGICLNNRFKDSMQTKLSCSLVCKYWNAAAQPFLFEYLQITSGERASVVADVLDDVSRKQHTQEGPGKWTIRIDLILEGVHFWSGNHSEAMSRIFKGCRNLLCFSAALSSDDPWTYRLPTFVEYLAHNSRLKRMEVRIDDKVLREIEILSNQLEVLWLLPRRPLIYPEESPQTKIFMPNLRALIATFEYEHQIKRFELPNLRACALCRDISCFPAIDKNLVEYLSVPSITDLNIWPNLITLSVNARDLTSQKIPWQEAFRHERLECITIEDIDFKRRKNPEGNYEDLHSQLEENLAIFLSPYQFPSLKCVKILLPVLGGRDYSHWLSEDEKSSWYAWLEACNNRGVHIKVSEGAMEWTADYWREYYHEEVFDMLFTPSSSIEEWFDDE